jgi:hypothetical protein
MHFFALESETQEEEEIFCMLNIRIGPGVSQCVSWMFNFSKTVTADYQKYPSVFF